MIAGLLYIATDLGLWEFVVGIFFSNFKPGKDSTPLQYQTNQNHNKCYQPVKST